MKNVAGAGSILQLPNLEALINNALSQGKKPLVNEKEFYQFLFNNNLSEFVRNRHQIRKWYKASWYLI